MKRAFQEPDEVANLNSSLPLSELMERTKKLGVGLCRRGAVNNRASGMSAPILGPTRPIACLTMIWITSAMSLEEAVDKYKDILIETANEISLEIANSANA